MACELAEMERQMIHWFLLAMIVIFLMSAIGKLSWLARGKLPQRNPAHEAVDVFLSVCIACWAMLLFFA